MPDRIFFLAIPEDAYEDFFTDDFIEDLLKKFEVKRFIYRIAEPGIELWIKKPIQSNCSSGSHRGRQTRRTAR